MLLVAEGPHLMLHDAASRGLIHGFHVKHSDQEISHLQYTDDTILF